VKLQADVIKTVIKSMVKTCGEVWDRSLKQKKEHTIKKKSNEQNKGEMTPIR